MIVADCFVRSEVPYHEHNLKCSLAPIGVSIPAQKPIWKAVHRPDATIAG